MNKRILLVLVVVLLCLLTITVLAHSGRTDANGGHWDRSTGEYHYHHGEPPHDHYDIDGDGDADCPIRYERANEQASEIKTSNWVKLIFWGVVACLIYILVLAFFVRSSNDELSEGCGCLIAYVIFGIVAVFIEEYPLHTLLALALLFSSFGLSKLYKRIDHKRHIDEYERTVNEYISCVEKLKEKEAEFFSFERIPVPDDCEVGSDRLPREKSASNKWGAKFTVYLTDNGGKIHTIRGCSSVFKERHIYKILRYKNFYQALCKRCGKNYVAPNMEWYENYLQYSELLREVLELPERIEILKGKIDECCKRCTTLSMKLILIFDKKSKNRLKYINKTIKQLL